MCTKLNRREKNKSTEKQQKKFFFERNEIQYQVFPMYEIIVNIEREYILYRLGLESCEFFFSFRTLRNFLSFFSSRTHE